MVSSRLLTSLATTMELADMFSDQSVLAAFLEFESSLSNAQAQLGIIPTSAAEAISRTALTDGFDVEAVARDARTCATIAVPLLKALSKRVAAVDTVAARFVHWGATSRDALDTVMSLLLSRAQTIVARDHARLAQSLRALSER